MATTTTITSAPAAFAPRAFDAKWLIIGLCVALTVYLGVVPLGFLLFQIRHRSLNSKHPI